MEKWNEYFRELLEGSKDRVVLEEKEEERREMEEREEKKEEEEENITKEKIVRQLKKLKRGKVPGEDGIENEAWRLMSEEIGDRFLSLMNRI